MFWDCFQFIQIDVNNKMIFTTFKHVPFQMYALVFYLPFNLLFVIFINISQNVQTFYEISLLNFSLRNASWGFILHGNRVLLHGWDRTHFVIIYLYKRWVCAVKSHSYDKRTKHKKKFLSTQTNKTKFYGLIELFLYVYVGFPLLY